MNLSVFILTRNRFHGAQVQVNRVIQSGINKNHIYLSDNSTDCNVGKELKLLATALGINYCLRHNLPTVFEHMKHCVSEVTTDYIMLLHDDDLVELDIFSHYQKVVSRLTYVDAIVGRNLINGQHSGQFKRVDNCENVNIEKLVAQYTYERDPYTSSFPFYLFRRSSLRKALDNHCDLGIYSDFSILLDIIHEDGKVVWTEKIVGNYGWHGNNLSSKINIDSRIEMVNLILSTKSTKINLQKVFGWFFTLYLIEHMKNFKFKNFLTVKNYFRYISVYEIMLYTLRLSRIRRNIKR